MCSHEERERETEKCFIYQRCQLLRLYCVGGIWLIKEHCGMFLTEGKVEVLEAEGVT